jgi:hypothetical protein
VDAAGIQRELFLPVALATGTATFRHDFGMLAGSCTLVAPFDAVADRNQHARDGNGPIGCLRRSPGYGYSVA